MTHYQLSHLDLLEHEAIHILRETAAQFAHAAILFSGGKDSLVLAALARKAFAPARPPFPLLHIDTGHNFPETLEFRDRLAAAFGYRLIIRQVQASIDAGRAIEETGLNASRNALQTVTLLDAIAELKLDAALGGGPTSSERTCPCPRSILPTNVKCFSATEPCSQLVPAYCHNLVKRRAANKCASAR